MLRMDREGRNPPELGQAQQAAPILVERPSRDRAVVTINRPGQRNALTLAMWGELAEVFEGLNVEPTLRSIILTGAGGAFCAGADIKEFARIRATERDVEAYAETVDRCTLAIADSPKATFAAVSGPAYGGGCGLAVACDFRVVERNASFAIPASKLGIVYGIEETRALYLTVGLVTAKEMLFSGRRYEAEEAARVGLATWLCDTDALSEAQQRASELGGSAPLSIAGSKAVLEALTSGETPDRQRKVEEITARAMASDDYREGREAFVEKRKPRFSGQ